MIMYSTAGMVAWRMRLQAPAGNQNSQKDINGRCKHETDTADKGARTCHLSRASRPTTLS